MLSRSARLRYTNAPVVLWKRSRVMYGGSAASEPTATTHTSYASVLPACVLIVCAWASICSTGSLVWYVSLPGAWLLYHASGLR